MMKRIALAALIACVLAPSIMADDDSSAGGRSPWFLGLAVSPEGFGGDSGLASGERLSLALVLDPCPWKIAVPSIAAGLSVPLFPWAPEASLFEARLDLRLFTLRPKLLESLYDGPAEYAPAICASAYWPLSGGDPFGSIGIRPLVFRTGDALYSILSVSTLVTRGADSGAAYNFRAFSVELFEFTHFFM